MADPATRFPWHEVVEGTEFQQGDLLAGCPVVRPSVSMSLGTEGVEVQFIRRTGIIVSQSCDLVPRPDGRRHLDDVLFCSIYSAGELAVHSVFGRPTGWEEARRGRMPSYHVLNECSLPGHERDFQLVDFTKVFTVGLDLVRELAVRQGRRLRLQPPYREHLSQAFARFFMRVGLPQDIRAFR
jgi:hypothetical protein